MRTNQFEFIDGSQAKILLLWFKGYMLEARDEHVNKKEMGEMVTKVLDNIAEAIEDQLDALKDVDGGSDLVRKKQRNNLN